MKHPTNNPWKLWRAEERARMTFQKNLSRIREDIEKLEEDMFRSLVRQYSQDKGFLRALSRFSGHTPYGWTVACGGDGRMIKLMRLLGWPQLNRLITIIRKKKGIIS